MKYLLLTTIFALIFNFLLAQNLTSVVVNDTIRYIYKSKRIWGYSSDDRWEMSEDSLQNGYWMRVEKYDGDTTFFTIKNFQFAGYYIRKKGNELSMIGRFDNGMRHGTWCNYRFQKLREEEAYEHGKLLESSRFYDNGQLSQKKIILYEDTYGSENPSKNEYFITDYYENGFRKEQGIITQYPPYVQGPKPVKNGQWLVWNDKGILAEIGYYKDDKRDSENIFFDEIGRQFKHEIYRNGILKLTIKFLLPERDNVASFTELWITAKGKIKKKIVYYDN